MWLADYDVIMLMFILLNLVEFLVMPKVNINLTTDVLKIQKNNNKRWTKITYISKRW